MKIISIILLSVIISVFAVYLLIVGRYEKKLKTEAILPATAEGLYSNVKINFSEVDNKVTESSYIYDLSDD